MEKVQVDHMMVELILEAFSEVEVVGMTMVKDQKVQEKVVQHQAVQSDREKAYGGK